MAKASSKDRDVFAFIKNGIEEEKRTGEKTPEVIEIEHLRALIGQYESKVRELRGEVEKFRTAVEHCKREFYNRGRRDTLWELTQHAEQKGPPEAGDLRNMYAQAVRDFANFPRAN